MSRYAFTWTFKNGRLPVGEGSWVWEVNKEKQTDRDSLTLPLEVKAFEGQRVQVRGGTIERLFESSLTGLSATVTGGTLYGKVEQYEFLDTFTGTNGDLLTGHTPDIYQIWGTWSTFHDPTFSGEPSIQSNRLRGVGASEYFAGNSEAYPSVDPWWLRADVYRRNTTGATDNVNGIAFCATSSGLSGGSECFAFGWNELNDYWELVRYWGGFYSASLGTSSTGAFTGSSQTRRLEVRVTGSSLNLNIECWVDGVSVITYNETVFALDLNSWGVFFGGDDSVDIDFIGSISDAPKLSGLQVTVTGGQLAAGNVELTGHQLVVQGGFLGIGGGGGAVTQPLTGLSLSVSQGTAKGWISVGENPLAASTSTLYPELAATRVATSFFPGTIEQKFLNHDGILHGVGEKYDPNNVANTDDIRTGVFKVSQGQTPPWTQAGQAYTASDVDSLSTERSFGTIGNYFPYNGLAQSSGWQYNFASGVGGFFSLDPRGNIHAASQRAFAPALPTGLGYQGALHYQQFYDTTFFLAWQKGDFAPSAHFYGPPLFVNRWSLHDPHRASSLKAMGLYAVSADEAIAFYPRAIDTHISGVEIETNGSRLVVRGGTLTASHTSANPSIPLIGLAVTVSAGAVRRDGTESGVNVEVPLTGLRINMQTNYGLNERYHNVIPERGDVNIVPAFRKIRHQYDGATFTQHARWSDEVRAASFSGASRVWALHECLTVVPTGVGDLIYAAYASTRTYVDAQDVIPPVTHIGIAVIDVSTMTVHSNTLYPINTWAQAWAQVGKVAASRNTPTGSERPVAQVVTLSDGRRVTQFLLRGQIVHVQFTEAGVLTPTVTLKTGPTLSAVGPYQPYLISDWETLEVRFDRVYHVLYRIVNGREEVANVVVNDATTTDSTWSIVAANHSGGTFNGTTYVLEPVDGDVGGEHISGYGGRKLDGGWYKSFLYVHRWEQIFTYTQEENVTVWVDFFKGFPKVFHVPMQLRTGRVVVNVTPNVQLTGLRTEVSGGTVFGLGPGSKAVALTGKRITVSTNPRILKSKDFVLDTFSGTTIQSILTHTPELGGPWDTAWGIVQYRTSGFGYTEYITPSTDFVAYAHGEPDRRDYTVKAKYVALGSPTLVWSEVPNDAIGARINTATGSGYFFGWYFNSSEWMLYKRGGDNAGVLARTSDAFGTEVQIEVSGLFPTRIRCFVNGVVVITYYDNGTQFSDPGRAGFYSKNADTVVLGWDYINAYTEDGTYLILDGQAVTLGQGLVEVAGGLTGLRVNVYKGNLVGTAQNIEGVLVGQAVTISQGTIFPVQGEGILTGQAVTVSGGTIGVPTYQALTGLRTNVYGGWVALLNRELPGLRIDMRHGLVVPVIDDTAALVGQQVLVSQGVLTPDITRSLTGLPTGVTAGNVMSVVAALLTGQQVEVRPGALDNDVEVVVSLVGQSCTVTNGTLTRQASNTSALDGEAASVAAGNLAVALSTGLVGAALAARAGSLTPMVSPVLTGQGASVQPGTLGVQFHLSLVGQQSSVAGGALGYSYGSSVAVQGEKLRLRQGVIPMPGPRAGSQVWVTMTPDGDEMLDAPDESFVTRQPPD